MSKAPKRIWTGEWRKGVIGVMADKEPSEVRNQQFAHVPTLLAELEGRIEKFTARIENDDPNKELFETLRSEAMTIKTLLEGK